jgi:hypothetical protein
MEDILEQNCLKKKRLIKDVIDYYRTCYYPLYIYQVIYDGEVKHISSRDKDIKSFNIKDKDSYYRTTILTINTLSQVSTIRDVFSVNDFVDDLCSMKGPSGFIFPKIETESLYNLNLYYLCLDYKTTRDMIRYIKGSI